VITLSTLSVWIDESEKDDLLAVGGILVEWGKVLEVVGGWRDMKTGLNLNSWDEVKWTLPTKHKTRSLLEESGRKTRELSERAIEYISNQDMLSIVVGLMRDQRNINIWKKIWSKASVRDFYCEGLKYVLQRAVEEVVESNANGCVVICDTPSLGKQEFSMGSIKRGNKAVELKYLDWYNTGVGERPGGNKYGSLQEIGFHPSILIGDATYHDMLQIADVVVGATRSWAANVICKKDDDWLINQMNKLCTKFRSRCGKPGFWGDGLTLHPRNEELWQNLKQSLK